MSEHNTDWAAIQAEYINTDISLPKLAEKYGVSFSTLRKRSASGKWSEKRKKTAAKKAERVTEKLLDKGVRQSVKDIERICRSAGKLIDKVNIAIAQIDKTIYISYDEQSTEEQAEERNGVTYSSMKKSRKMRTAQAKALVDTKRLADLAKTLVNLKEVLTGETGEADNTESSGVIEIAAATLIDAREDRNEDDLETAAETGGDDGAR